MTEKNEKTPQQLFEEIVMDKNGKSLMDLLFHPDLSEFVKTFNDEVECDEKDNPNLQKIVDKMIEERKAQKLWNRLKDELGFTMEACDRIVDLVEDWMGIMWMKKLFTYVDYEKL